VQRGSHELRAAISDTNGKRLIESSVVQFTMRRAARTGPSATADAAPAEPDSQQETTAPTVVETEPAAAPEPD